MVVTGKVTAEKRGGEWRKKGRGIHLKPMSTTFQLNKKTKKLYKTIKNKELNVPPPTHTHPAPLTHMHRPTFINTSNLILPE